MVGGSLATPNWLRHRLVEPPQIDRANPGLDTENRELRTVARERKRVCGGCGDDDAVREVHYKLRGDESRFWSRGEPCGGGHPHHRDCGECHLAHPLRS